MTASSLMLAVPCRTDEPALGRTLAAALESWRRTATARSGSLDVLVCLNGTGGEAPRRDLDALAARVGAPVTDVDLDAGASLPARPPGPVAFAALRTRRAGKPIAWNALRRLARDPVAVFMDADVSFAPDAIGLLVDALARHPDAALASGKTTCAPRPGVFESIMAAPYGVDFPNLSPQLYAARLAALPAALPEDLLEPEHWIELVLGPARIVRVPAATVAVRLPGTLPDFFRQRIRIEMGKVQIAREYPGLADRVLPQPGARAAVYELGPAGVARLGAYVALRTAAHAVAWWRYRRGETAGIWRQAATTKSWGAG